MRFHIGPLQDRRGCPEGAGVDDKGLIQFLNKEIMQKNRLTKTAQRLRKEATPWENKLWYEFLRSYKIPVHRQKVIDNYIVDFYCRKARLAIELDGSGHFYDNKIESVRIRTEKLNSLGIEVLRFSNLDIDTNFYEVCSVIDEKIKSKLKD